MRKPQPKPLKAADARALSDEQLQRHVKAGAAALWLIHNPKHDRIVRRLINNHDLAQDEIARRKKEAAH